MGAYVINVFEEIGHQMYEPVAKFPTDKSLLEQFAEEGIQARVLSEALLLCQQASPEDRHWSPYVSSAHPHDRGIAWLASNSTLLHDGRAINQREASELLRRRTLK